MDKNVDYEIEQFWLGFKVSMTNFYQKQTQINRPIQQWSDHLNMLQKRHDYEGIEECIVKYISLYSMDLMRTHSSYNIRILNTNIKRWDKICNKSKIFVKRSSYNNGCNLIITLLDIYSILADKHTVCREIFDELEIFIFFHDFRSLIIYARDQKIPSIIDKLLKYNESIFYQIKELYQLDDTINYPISAHKIFKSMNIM
jgi:hypothetical protein